MSSPAALERGLQVLTLLAKHSAGLSFSEIAKSIQASNASTMRLLNSLCELGFIKKLRDNQGYQNSSKVSQLVGNDNIRQRFQEAAQTFLNSLQQRTGNTAISIYWSGSSMICLDRIMHEDASPLQEPGHVVKNLHVAPWGWLFKSIDWWQQQDSQIISKQKEKGYQLSLQEIIDNLERLAERGFTYLPGPERRRLAAPVYAQDKIIGALCLGGNIFTMPDNEIEHYGGLLARSAEACSELMQ